MIEYILAGIGLYALGVVAIFIIDQIIISWRLKSEKQNNSESIQHENKVLNEILRHKYNPKDDPFIKRFEKKMDDIIRK